MFAALPPLFYSGLGQSCRTNWEGTTALLIIRSWNALAGRDWSVGIGLAGCASPYIGAPVVSGPMVPTPIGPPIVQAPPPVIQAPVPQAPIAFAPAFENPVLLTVSNHEVVWETVVDVVDDYFRIAEERPVRLVGNLLTEGRLDTLPETGATLLEPWRRDSASAYERLESTLQSIRRFAVVRVIPANQCFRVDVQVYKELEDVVQPDQTTAGDATLRYDTTLTRVVNPIGELEVHEGWIPKGRDIALEQAIIAQLLARFPTMPR